MFDIKIGQLDSATISAVFHQGLTVTLPNGKKARLAIIDEAGTVIDDSPTVAKEAWNVAMTCFKNFWIGQGHLRVSTTPTGLKKTTAA